MQNTLALQYTASQKFRSTYNPNIYSAGYGIN